VVWCGVVWCGVVWCGVVWCGVVWCGVVCLGAYVPWRWENVSTGADTHDSNLGAAPAWSAFRESSFGVAELTVLNETHMSLNWLRHACESDSSDALHMNFSDSCVTPGDDSPMNMLISDSTMIIRPDVAACSNRYVSTASGDDDIFGKSSTGSDDDRSSDIVFSTLEIILIVVVIVLIISNVAAMYLLHKSRQPSGSTSHDDDHQEVVSPVSKNCDLEMK
jgi:hypothetical protein